MHLPDRSNIPSGRIIACFRPGGEAQPYQWGGGGEEQDPLPSLIHELEGNKLLRSQGILSQLTGV